MSWYPRPGERVAIEVALTSPDQEIKNAIADFACGGNISRLVIACRDQKMVEMIQKRVLQCPELDSFRDRIHIILLSIFIELKNKRRDP